MSFYYVKSIRLDRKNNKIVMQASDSSVYPRTWFSTEYGVKENLSLEEKVKNMLVSMMNGNLKPWTNNNYRRLISECEGYLEEASGGYDLFEKDIAYGTSLYKQAMEKIVTLYAVPALLEGKKATSQLSQFLDEYPSIVQKAITQKKKEMADKGIVSIFSACGSNVFTDMVVLIDIENQTWLAPKEDYKPGRLDNSKGNALCFGKNQIAWDVLMGMTASQYTFMMQREKNKEFLLEIEENILHKDMYLEALWENLRDVLTDKNECIDQFWFIFEKGTFREDIWRWFDERYSKGVGKLMFKK